MYTEDDTMTPRDRISEDMLKRILQRDNDAVSSNRCSENSCRIPRDRHERSNSNMRSGKGLEGHPLASVYSPIQQFRKLYDTETALNKGTLFSELDLPFMGASVANGSGCNTKGGLCRG